MKGLMIAARAAERRPGVVSASVMGGFAYADVANMGPSVITVANADRELARVTAEDLADQLWNARHQLNLPWRRPKMLSGARRPRSANPWYWWISAITSAEARQVMGPCY